jgi:hypothetical protein
MQPVRVPGDDAVDRLRLHGGEQAKVLGAGFPE